eukprot:TRINITY_DN267_c0_g1_i1.p1 TRINITY_DN267_c0_g1~~TRINITY_DN267_c0_g1_i1.p1  ORF type:complete len:191 (-),score=47.84 TRINITY_DN267_c0_g1_i1:124-696(-)
MSSFSAFGDIVTQRKTFLEKVVLLVLVACLTACIVGNSTRGWLTYDKEGLKLTYGLWNYCMKTPAIDECVTKSQYDDLLKQNTPSLYDQTNICRVMICCECGFALFAVILLAAIAFNNKTSLKSFAMICTLLTAVCSIINWATFIWIHKKIDAEDDFVPSLAYDFYMQPAVSALGGVCVGIIQKYFVTSD